MTIFGRVNHLGAEPGTQAYQPEPAFFGRLEWVRSKSWGRKHAHRVIRKPVVSQCGAGAWLNGLARGDQYRLAGGCSASEACSRQCAIQIHRYLILLICLLPSGECICIVFSLKENLLHWWNCCCIGQLRVRVWSMVTSGAIHLSVTMATTVPTVTLGLNNSFIQRSDKPSLYG